MRNNSNNSNGSRESKLTENLNRIKQLIKENKKKIIACETELTNKAIAIQKKTEFETQIKRFKVEAQRLEQAKRQAAIAIQEESSSNTSPVISPSPSSISVVNPDSSNGSVATPSSSSSSITTSGGEPFTQKHINQAAKVMPDYTAGDMSLSHKKNGLTHTFDKNGTTQTLNFTSESNEDVIKAMITAQFQIQKAQGGKNSTEINIRSIVIDGASFDDHELIATIAKQIGFTNINVDGKNYYHKDNTASMEMGKGKQKNTPQPQGKKISTDDLIASYKASYKDTNIRIEAYANDLRAAFGMPVTGMLSAEDAIKSKDELNHCGDSILDNKGRRHIVNDVVNFTEERDLAHFIKQYTVPNDKSKMQSVLDNVAIAAFHKFKEMTTDQQLAILKATDKHSTPYDFTKLPGKKADKKYLGSAIRAGAFLAYHSQQYQLSGVIPTSETIAKGSLRGAKSQYKTISSSVLKSLEQHGISARLLNKALAERAIVDTALDNLIINYTDGLTDIGPVTNPGNLGLTATVAPAPAPTLKVDDKLTEMDRYDLRAQTLAQIAKLNALKNPSNKTLDSFDLQKEGDCKKFLSQLTGIEEIYLKNKDICPWSVQRVLTHLRDEDAAKTMVRRFNEKSLGIIKSVFGTLDPKIAESATLIAKFPADATADDVIDRLRLNDSTAKQDVRQWITNKALENNPQHLQDLFQAASEPTDAKLLLSVFDDAGEEYKNEKVIFQLAKAEILHNSAWNKTVIDYNLFPARNAYFCNTTIPNLKEFTLAKEIEPSKPNRIFQALEFLQNSNPPGPSNYFVGKIKNALEYASQKQLADILTEVLKDTDAAKALRRLYTPAVVAVAVAVAVAPAAAIPGSIRNVLEQGIDQGAGTLTVYTSADNFAAALYTASSQTHTTTINDTAHDRPNTMIATLKLYGQHSCGTIKGQAIEKFKEQLGQATTAELLAISNAINTDPTAKPLLLSTLLYPHCHTLNLAITAAIETPSQVNSQAVLGILDELMTFNSTGAVITMNNSGPAVDMSDVELKAVFDEMLKPNLKDKVKHDLQAYLSKLSADNAELHIIKMALAVSKDPSETDTKLGKILELETDERPISDLVKAIIQAPFQDNKVKTKLLNFEGEIQDKKFALEAARQALDKADTPQKKIAAMFQYFITFGNIQDIIHHAHRVTIEQGSPNITLTSSYRALKEAFYTEIQSRILMSKVSPTPGDANAYCGAMIRRNQGIYKIALKENNVDMQSFALDQLKDIVEFMESVDTTESDKLRRDIFTDVLAMNNAIVGEESQSINSKMKESMTQTLEENGGQAGVFERVIEHLEHGNPTPDFSEARPSDLTIIRHTVTKQREAAIQCYKLLEKKHNALSKIFGEIDSPVNTMIATEVNIMIATDKAKHKDMIQEFDNHIKIVQAEILKRTPRSSSRSPTNSSRRIGLGRSQRIINTGKKGRNRSRSESPTTTDISSRDSSDDEDNSSSYPSSSGY